MFTRAAFETVVLSKKKGGGGGRRKKKRKNARKLENIDNDRKDQIYSHTHTHTHTTHTHTHTHTLIQPSYQPTTYSLSFS